MLVYEAHPIQSSSNTRRENRVVLTHDVSTMAPFAYERVRRGDPMPGVFVVEQELPIGQAIGDLLILAECSESGEWEG
jgi:hypothetical protein